MSGKPIRLALMGDLLVGMEYLPFAKSRNIGLLDVFEPIESLLREIDLGFINLEGPLERGDALKPGLTLHLSNDPVALEFCLRNKIQAVSTANNHMLDHGRESLVKTLDLLKGAGLSGVGAQHHAVDSLRPVVIERGDQTFGFLGFNAFPDEHDEPVIESISADGGSKGPIVRHKREEVLDAVKALKHACDYSLVSLHWGYEFYRYPSVGQRRLAHDLIDAGCNLVLGHHPHVVQGIEEYKSGLIIYSLGNFFFPRVRQTSGRLGYEKAITREFALVFIDIKPGQGFGWEIRGGKRGSDYRMNLYSDKENQRFENRLKQWSLPLASADYDRFWDAYHATRARQLEREGLVEAFAKIRNFSFGELIRTLRPSDFTRNVKRLRKVVFRT